MANKKILDVIPENRAFGFDHLMLELIKRKNLPKIKIHKSYWLDIGRPDDYAQAIDEFEAKKSVFLK